MVGWGLTWLALPVLLSFLSSFPLLFLSLLLLLGYPPAGARQCPGVCTTQGLAAGTLQSVTWITIEVGGGMPWWCRLAGVVWA